MATLVEKYTNRLTRANNEYKARTGRQLTEGKKILTAAVLENTAKFMNFRMNRMTEALDNSMGVQTSDVGQFKKFVLDVTETSIPNLVGPEICYVHTMDALSGWATYRKYTAGSRKGVRNSDGTFSGRFNQDESAIIGANDQEALIRGTLSNGKPQSEYTSKVVEVKTSTNASGEVTLRWTPILPGSVFVKVDADTYYLDDGAGNMNLYDGVASVEKVSENGVVTYRFFDANGDEVVPTANSGSVIYGTVRDDNYVAANAVDAPKIHGKVTLTGVASSEVEVAYQYNNEYIPKHSWGRFLQIAA